MCLKQIYGLCILMLLLHRTGSGKAFPTRPDHPEASFRQLFSREPLAQLNTAGSEYYLSEEEKLIVALCNLARHDGALFIREILIPSGTDTSLPAVRNLILRLKQTKNIQPLMPAYSLHKTARQHAMDMGFRGDSGHISSDGRTFHQRILPYFPNHAGFAENYHLGSGDASDIVLAMLSGSGDGSRYRENILSPDLHYIGVSISAHRKSCSNTVMDFAQKPRIPVGINGSKPKRKKSEAYFMDCPKGRDFDQRKKNAFSFLSFFSRNK